MSTKHDPVTAAYLNALMDPPDAPDNSHEAIAIRIIQDDDAWLRSAPRTTLEVAAHLFPEDLKASGASPNFLLHVALCMSAADYKAAPGVTPDQVWMPRQCKEVENSRENTPFEKVTPPLLIRGEAPPVIYKRKDEGVFSVEGSCLQSATGMCC